MTTRETSFRETSYPGKNHPGNDCKPHSVRMCHAELKGYLLIYLHAHTGDTVLSRQNTGVSYDRPVLCGNWSRDQLVSYHDNPRSAVTRCRLRSNWAWWMGTKSR